MLESAAYFCAVEALRAFEGSITLALASPEGRLTVKVSGQPKPSFEADTDHLVDRAETAGSALLREQVADSASVTLVLALPSDPLPLPDGPELVGVEG